MTYKIKMFSGVLVIFALSLALHWVSGAPFERSPALATFLALGGIVSAAWCFVFHMINY